MNLSIYRAIAVAHQIESNRYHQPTAPRVTTLLQDYTSTVVPNKCSQIFRGHRSNVKCVAWVGGAENSEWIVSGSSDNTVRLWDPQNGEQLAILEGHLSKIWDLCSNQYGTILASASGDSTVKLWDLIGAKRSCLQTLSGML